MTDQITFEVDNTVERTVWIPTDTDKHAGVKQGAVKIMINGEYSGMDADPLQVSTLEGQAEVRQIMQAMVNRRNKKLQATK